MTRITNVSERLKEAPAHALRAVFAGIGQALLVSDRVRHKLMSAPGAAEDAGGKAGRHPVRIPVTTPTAVKRAAQKPVTPVQAATVTSATKTARATQNRVASVTKPATSPVPAKPALPAPGTPAGRSSTATKPTAKHARANAGGKAPEPASQPPIPNYDELSIASLRARLRGLDLAQVRRLLSYERSRGSRSDVITMYERRITKLTEAGG
ncbi:MAG TPA: hypothetical protein VLW50_25540 [Streptosporangiaceae bacterium]|nr:hypothetical protein [Streptosporangiaceae bacterium]